MSFFSIWPLVVLVGICVAIFSFSRSLRFLDAAPTASPHRLETLDGLRGFLAVSVVFHHLSIKRWEIASGRWELPPSHFYSLLGQAGVTLFFMITGYLFWGRLQDQDGRIDWAGLYVNRFFRIAPLYLVVVLAYILIVLRRVAFHVPVSAANFASQVAPWLFFGMIDHPAPLLGDTHARSSAIGQTWTLHSEWIFYLLLPILAIFARSRSPLAICVTALFLVLDTGESIAEPYRYFIAQFLCGMLAASLLRAHPGLKGDGPVRSLIALAILTCAFRICDTAYSTSAVILFGLFFTVVASGTSLFGLLKLQGAKRMGNASYSIYMLHGIILTVLMAPTFLGFYAASAPVHFWMVATLTFAVVICVSLISYVVVERGGMKIGKNITSRKKAEIPSSTT